MARRASLVEKIPRRITRITLKRRLDASHSSG
jgi:hypothetical protein